ncbi:hypothetical protein P1J78_04950 [Psychromarinibacter sp. C21-152]|uniref:Uncharacterized protein n=1 Tax=Psychromarinibacter sediminicola TaxID=3033385 RepID=A0AAE3NMJ2_9RHOB|nr:hypothetical protein [Psychromarinibacter sediminicola]MDF0600073.1 hypothetical protein [Psychromarinibacter sediminicola]
MIDQAVFLERLSAELAGLGRVASGLQEAIHDLPLSHSGRHTRRVLQSADVLTQSLVCLSAAVHGLSDLSVATREHDLSDVLDAVFLEDLRARLTEGRDHSHDPGRAHPGEIDLF